MIYAFHLIKSPQLPHVVPLQIPSSAKLIALRNTISFHFRNELRSVSVGDTWYRWTGARWLINTKDDKLISRIRVRWMLCVVNTEISCSKDCQKRSTDNGNSDDFLEFRWISSAKIEVKKHICGANNPAPNKPKKKTSWRNSDNENEIESQGWLLLWLWYVSFFFLSVVWVYWSSAQDFSVWIGFSINYICIFVCHRRCSLFIWFSFLLSLNLPHINAPRER